MILGDRAQDKAEPLAADKPQPRATLAGEVPPWTDQTATATTIAWTQDLKALLGIGRPDMGAAPCVEPPPPSLAPKLAASEEPLDATNTPS